MAYAQTRFGARTGTGANGDAYVAEALIVSQIDHRREHSPGLRSLGAPSKRPNYSRRIRIGCARSHAQVRSDCRSGIPVHAGRSRDR